MKKLKIGIIGLGFVGILHLDAIRRIPYAEVVAVADTNIDHARKVGEEYGVLRYYDCVDHMLEDGDLDVIHNCTPNYMHKEINIKVIQRGIHIFSEKPLTKTAGEAKEILDVLKLHPEVVAGVNHCYRMNPMVQEMYSLIQEGKIGVPRIVHGKYVQDYLSDISDYSWRMDPEISGPSRAIADIGIHIMDTIQFVLDAKITDVCADIYTAIPERHKPRGQVATFSKNEEAEYDVVRIETEDYGAVLFKMDNGMHGVYYVSEISPGHGCGLWLEVDASEASIAWNQEQPNQLYVGERKSGICQIERNPVELGGRAKRYTSLAKGHPEGWNDAEVNCIKRFYEYVRLEKKDRAKPEFATFEEAYYLMKVVEAILQSGRRGEWIHIS